MTKKKKERKNRTEQKKAVKKRIENYPIIDHLLYADCLLLCGLASKNKPQHQLSKSKFMGN